MSTYIIEWAIIWVVFIYYVQWSHIHITQTGDCYGTNLLGSVTIVLMMSASDVMVPHCLSSSTSTQPHSYRLHHVASC